MVSVRDVLEYLYWGLYISMFPVGRDDLSLGPWDGSPMAADAPPPPPTSSRDLFTLIAADKGLQINLLALFTVVLIGFQVLLGSRRRRSGNKVIVNLLSIAYTISFPVFVYTIGLVQSIEAPKRLDSQLLWAVGLLLLLGSVDGMSAFSRRDVEQSKGTQVQHIVKTVLVLWLLVSRSDLAEHKWILLLYFLLCWVYSILRVAQRMRALRKASSVHGRSETCSSPCEVSPSSRPSRRHLGGGAPIPVLRPPPDPLMANTALPLPLPPPIPPGFIPTRLPSFSSLSFKDALLSPAPASPAGPAAPAELTEASRPQPTEVSRPLLSERPRPQLRSVIIAAASSERNDGGGWTTVGGRRSSLQKRPSFSFGGLEFRTLLLKKAKGRCFRCLSSDHRIISCRNPAKCLLCGDLGHKARWCTNPKFANKPLLAQAQARPQVPARPQAQDRQPPQARPPPPPAPGPARPTSTVISSSPKFTNMEAPGGDRVRFVSGVAPRTAAIADAEWALMRHAVVATVISSPIKLQLAQVVCAFAARFMEAEAAVQASWISQSELLIWFTDPQVRARALALEGLLKVGQVSFSIAQWTRFRKATAETLPFRARVCIEGVPKNAWNLPAVTPLFDPNVILDAIDESCKSEEETACFKIWLWIDDINKIATRGVLRLEEPAEIGSQLVHCPELGIFADIPKRVGPIRLLSHQVLLHLDEVHVYASSPDSRPASLRSNNSDVSGLPFDPSSGSEITKWHYRWILGYEAGSFPPAPPRGSVHSWVRFPGPGGGDDSGAGDAGQGARRPDGGRGGTARQSRRDRAPSTGEAGGASSHGHGAGGRRRDVGEDMPVMVAQGPPCPSTNSAATTGTGDGPHTVVALTTDEGALPLSSEDGQLGSSPVRESQEAVFSAQQPAVPGTHALPVPELSPVPSQDGHLPLRVHHVTSTTTMEQVNETGLEQQLLSCFGPHSPKGPRTICEGQVHPASAGSRLLPLDASPRLFASPARLGLLDILDTNHGLPDAPANTLAFVNDLAAPISPPLCTPPVTTAPKSTKPSKGDPTLRSSRLAAKPSAGLATMDKVKLVLLKKHGVDADEANPKDALKKYNSIYKQQLPPDYIKAVASLVDAAKPGRKGGAPAMQASVAAA